MYIDESSELNMRDVCVLHLEFSGFVLLCNSLHDCVAKRGVSFGMRMHLLVVS